MTGTKRRKIETTKIVMTIGNVKSDLMSHCIFPPSNRQVDFSTKMFGFAANQDLRPFCAVTLRRGSVTRYGDYRIEFGNCGRSVRPLLGLG